MSGIKITHAIDGNGNRVNADTDGRVPTNSRYTCPDERCGASLSYVKGFKRESYGKQQFIPAYFRLEKGADHTEFCSFKSVGKVSISVDKSDSDVQNALSRGELVFRIHLMDSEEKKRHEIKEIESRNKPVSDTTKKHYQKKGKKETYVNKIKDLLSIYNYGLENKEDKGRIKIIVGGKTVSWLDFFYPEEYLNNLYKKIDSSKSNIQAAVVFTARERSAKEDSSVILEGKSFFYILSKRKVLGVGQKYLYLAVKLSGKMSGYKALNSETILVFGSFSIPTCDHRVKSANHGNELQTLVNNENQIFKLTPAPPKS